MDQGDELAETARKYLDLWMEHWASCLNAPETTAAMVRIMTWLAGTVPSHDNGPAAALQGHEPSTLRTAPSVGGGRVDDLEKRIAELEHRLALVEAGNGTHLAKPSGRPRRRTRPA
jgi:hypothetical protein